MRRVGLKQIAHPFGLNESYHKGFRAISLGAPIAKVHEMVVLLLTMNQL